MMLRERYRLEAQLLGHLRQLGHLREHLLNLLRPMGDRTQSLAFLRRSWDYRIDMQHELHFALTLRARDRLIESSRI